MKQEDFIKHMKHTPEQKMIPKHILITENQWLASKKEYKETGAGLNQTVRQLLQKHYKNKGFL